MANHLKMAKIHAIQVLRGQGWSFRRIGRELGVHRDTARRYVELEQAAAESGPLPVGSDGENRPNPPPGSGDQNRPNLPPGSGGENRPNLPPGSALDGQYGVAGLTREAAVAGQGSSGPASRCEPFRDIVIGALEQGLSAQRIWQDLRAEHGFEGGYDSVKRFVRRLGATTPLRLRARTNPRNGATVAHILSPHSEHRGSGMPRRMYPHLRQRVSRSRGDLR